MCMKFGIYLILIRIRLVLVAKIYFSLVEKLTICHIFLYLCQIYDKSLVDTFFV